MTTTNRSQRLKEVLKGTSISSQRMDAVPDAQDKLVQVAQAGNTSQDTVQRLKQILHRNGTEEGTRTHRLREVLQQKDNKPRRMKVCDFIKEHTKHVGRPAVASCEEEPVQPRAIASTHTDSDEPKNTKTTKPNTVDRLRRILGKDGAGKTPGGHEPSCNGEGRAIKVVDKEVGSVTPTEERASSSCRQEHAPASGVTFNETVEVISASERSTPEPQDCSTRRPRKISKRRLPQKVRTDVVIVGVRSNLIYVQDVSALRELVKTMQTLQSVIAGDPPLTKVPELKTYVAALRPEDNTWYRARIERDGGAGVEVFYVDYGNKGTVGAKSLKALPEPFLDIPAYAMSVRPHGLDKVDVDVGACLQGQVFVAEVVESVGKKRVVKLYEKESGQCINEMLEALLEVSKEDLTD